MKLKPNFNWIPFSKVDIDDLYFSINSNQKLRLSLIGLAWFVILLSLTYHQAYPLTISEGAFFWQVPILFWGAIFLGVASLLIGVSGVNFGGALIATVAFWAMMNSRVLFYFQLLMPDATSISYYSSIVLNNQFLPTINSPDFFEYIQWPLHFLLTKVFSNILGFQMGATIKTGYYTYTLLFGIIVFLFIYIWTDSPTPSGLFLQSACYFTIVYVFLNNQYVPQFLALLLLFLILSVDDRVGQRFKILRYFIFIALVFSHPFMWIFYLGSYFLHPIYQVTQTVLNERNEKSPIYSNIFYILCNPLSFFGKFWSIARPTHIKPKWMRSAVTLGVIYTSSVIFRFTLFPQEAYFVLANNSPLNNLAPQHIIFRITPGFLQDLLPQSWGMNPSGQETMLQYQLISQEIDAVFRWMTMAILVLILIIFLISFLLEFIKNVKPMSVSIASFSVGYFFIGSFLPILGARALQVGFLPLVLFNKVILERKAVAVILMVVLLMTPGLLANSMVNRTLAAGENSGDLYTSKAGEWVQRYANDPLVQRRGNLNPILLNNNNIVPLDNFLQLHQNKSSIIFIDSPLTRVRTQYLGYKCNLVRSKTTIVYDNHAKAMLTKNISCDRI